MKVKILISYCKQQITEYKFGFMLYNLVKILHILH
jgi:hypothetical protein